MVQHAAQHADRQTKAKAVACLENLGIELEDNSVKYAA
jgi:hypothetical protein